MVSIKNLFVLSLLVFAQAALADGKFVRWTGAEDKNADFAHIVEVVADKADLELAPTDFLLVEDRELANNHFRMYVQLAGGVPMKSMSIRTWTDKTSGEAIQVEAMVDSVAPIQKILKRFAQMGMNVSSMKQSLSSEETMKLVRATVQKNPDDRQIRSVDWSDNWDSSSLVRVVRVKGKHGKHTITISVPSKKVIAAAYEEFPQADQADEFSIPAQVYPIYEETEKSSGTLLPRVPVFLKYLKKFALRPTVDPYEALRTRTYPEGLFDPILGLTEAGRAQGFWSMAYIKDEAAKLRAKIPLSPNTFEFGGEFGGVILEGRYVTVNLHQGALKFKGLNFAPKLSGQFRPDWRETEVNGHTQAEMVPTANLLGRPLMSATDAWDRVARRLPDHNPVEYINDGFDEVQVYYAVNTLMDSLANMGFTDPEISTRPFHAYLYDPDISYKDNAYYTDDTINFTTYSPNAQNFARDNSTIWHELGHGIMDRLMGDSITLADTGGLSEGMADFVAALVIADVTDNQPFPGSDDFRIINKTGFNLTNEVHDDGESYGGAMRDMMVAAIQKWGKAGLVKMTDLTLEAMRLSRNHPALSADDWFSHMLFADELGNGSIRAKGEMKDVVLSALASRNFAWNDGAVANYSLAKVDASGSQEITGFSAGSRRAPIPVSLKADEQATYTLNVKLTNSANYQFKFPVQVKVYFRSGPLQGAIHWEGEEKEPLTYTINSEADTLPIDLKVSGKCDEINREDGSCVDYAYVQIWNNGENEKPQAKKRFYLRVKTADAK